MTISQVKEAFSKRHIELSDHQCQQFVHYYDLLVEWNSKINLTAITKEDEVIEKHFIDSVLASKIVDFNNYYHLVDIGTGAGFPGIPLKILFPNLKVTLVDALNKRILFLQTVISGLDLNHVEAIHGRAEDLARTNLRDSADLCVSRAVSQLNVLCEYCLPFIKVGGLFISYKGSKTREELDQSKNAIELLGAELDQVTDTVLLSDKVNRGFVCIKKISSTPDIYPRRAGKPSKKPL